MVSTKAQLLWLETTTEKREKIEAYYNPVGLLLRPKHETSIKIFISGSCPGVRDCDHGDGGQAVQQPVHHRGGPEEAAGGGQGGKHRRGDPQNCYEGLQEFGIKCNKCAE